ncbi:hypothetical protein QYH69_30730 [Paraburkholderia sp. SARCC-3016]|jgi:hypothetical protein|nr:hypothetical protein [Paraburkholderia sp. SARCC-3016]MDQ7981605.1 hypothetical protein [Paraburkholderia sp. SARCC-3016]
MSSWSGAGLVFHLAPSDEGKAAVLKHVQGKTCERKVYFLP